MRYVLFNNLIVFVLCVFLFFEWNTQFMSKSHFLYSQYRLSIKHSNVFFFFIQFLVKYTKSNFIILISWVRLLCLILKYIWLLFARTCVCVSMTSPQRSLVTPPSGEWRSDQNVASSPQFQTWQRWDRSIGMDSPVERLIKAFPIKPSFTSS